jgi:Na+-transporting NADH:ubiquinone oxidoreductase subunit A
VGGLFTGYTGSAAAHLGLYETSLTLVPEGDDAEFLALFRPGIAKPTYSRLFLSRVRSDPLVFDCNRRGGVRACIGCMHCADVCPVDILPQMAYKAVLAEEVEESLEHGLLDCTECGLCSYVCPSKIELTEVLKKAKAAYAREKA